MVKKIYPAEQIISMFKEAEGLINQGQTVPAASKAIGVTDQTCYRWCIYMMG